MSIQVHQAWDTRLNRAVIQIIVFGKHRPIQVGEAWMGKRIAARAFKNAIRMLMRGT